MDLSIEQITEKWDLLISIIEANFSDDRKDKLLKMYDDFQERVMLSPASSKEFYHSCFPGGYLCHILNVMNVATDISKLWTDRGATVDWTHEELVFAAMHHDLGKLGDLEHEQYVPQESEWHRKNRGELFAFNADLQYMSVPHRAQWILNQYQIVMSQKEWLSIQLADGLFDEANKPYLRGFSYEFRMRTNLPYIIHHADMMATRIEQNEWEVENDGYTTSVSKKKSVKVRKPPVKELADVLRNKPSSDQLKKKFEELFGDGREK